MMSQMILDHIASLLHHTVGHYDVGNIRASEWESLHAKRCHFCCSGADFSAKYFSLILYFIYCSITLLHFVKL